MLKTQLKISSMHLCLDVWKCLIKVWWQEEVSLRVIWKGTPPVWFLWYLFDILCKQEKALIFAVLLCRWFMVSLLSAFNRFHHCTESAGWRPDPASGSPGRSIRCRMENHVLMDQILQQLVVYICVKPFESWDMLPIYSWFQSAITFNSSQAPNTDPKPIIQ